MIGVVDSGVDDQHYALNDNIWHNSSEIAGGTTEVAYNARILLVRVLGDDGGSRF